MAASSAADLSFRLGGFDMRVVPAQELLVMASSGRLRLWAHNRSVDTERVRRLYDDQVRRLGAGCGLSLFAPTPFVAHEGPAGHSKAPPPLDLLDGQHRLEVLKCLAVTHPDVVGELRVLLGVTRADASMVFEQVNSGTPVPAAYYNARVQALVREFLTLLCRAYPLAVADAQRPQRPNFNTKRTIDEMTAYLPFRDAVIDGVVSAKLLYEMALEENSIEEHVTANGQRALPAGVVARAHRTGFYLGLREGWPVAIAALAVRAANAAARPGEKR